MIRFTVFDRWGNQTDVVNDVIEAVHKDEVNGEDSLTLVLTSCDLSKGDRIVWRDKFGQWHEHIVNDLKQTHGDGKMLTTAYCENSIAELFTDYIEDLRPYNTSAYTALQRALSVTRWQIGTVDDLGTSSTNFYHESAREALSDIIEAWGGELSTTIEVSGASVSARKVNITVRGSDNGKRFEWTKDMESITREVSTDDVVTALYGYGKGLEAYDEDGNATGGYERKLTFGDINGGLDYVADEDAKELWGLPDGKGGIKHTFGKVEFSDCEDMQELLELTRKELAVRCKPQVTYTASVIDLADAGFEGEDVQAGDRVAVIDRELGERLTGRVLCVERHLFNEQATSITLGNVSRNISDVISATQSSLGKLQGHSSAWDGAASISTGYINAVINSLNAAMNQSGGYTYYKPGEGLITYDKPEDQNPTMAIQIKGAGFRIANSKKSNGDWNWRTFGTGAGFTADEINAGTLNAALIKAGIISDLAGKNYWNMETGEFSLSANASVGNATAGAVVVSADVQYGFSDDASTQPTSWTTTALWRQGKHMWTRTKMTLADGSVQYSAARRISNENGIGASEVVEQYYLSTSSTEQAGGSWQTTQPTWVKGRYYWTRSRIRWSNGTYTYTDPVLARALTSGNQKTDDLDDSLTQLEVFNRLTNNGQTQGIYLSNSRLYINASYIATGTISDAAGNNYWNLTSGYLRTTSGYIGGLSIQSSYIGNSVFRLNSTGVHFYYSDYEVGKIGTNSYSGDSTKRGLVFDLEDDGAYMTWACKDSASASTYSMKLSYINKSFSSFAADTIALGCNLDGRGFLAKNFWIDPNNGGANGGITDTLTGMLPTSIRSDGTVASWTTNVHLQFKRGLLVDMYS